MVNVLPPDFCPYKGLQPYTEADRAFFFGRERDQEIVTSNLYAAPLTVLYGESGVGKSSVLLAGVVPLLRQTPNLAVVVFRQWQNRNFESALKGAITSAVKESTGRDVVVDQSLPLDEFIIICNRALRGPVFIILDQFEEFFLYHAPGKGEDSFDAEWARSVNRQDVDANFLVSMREDGLSSLDRFRGRIPKLLSNTLRLKHLDHEAGRAAILNPVEKYNELLPAARPRVTIEDALVEELLNEVKTGRVQLAQAGQGRQFSARPQEGTQEEVRIETPFLQMVLTRLWNEERANRSHTLHLKTFRKLGGAERIIRTHLDKVMEKLSDEERRVAARLFRYLVTPSGSKIAHAMGDLVAYAELPAAEVEPVLKLLGSPDVRILRAIAPPLGHDDGFRYEIFHDVLAQAILNWHARYAEAQKKIDEQKELQEERAEAQRKLAAAQARTRRLRWGAVGLSITLVVMIGLLIWGLIQRKKLEGARAEAYSRELAAFAYAELDRDPDLSLLLAMEATRLSPYSQAAVYALKDAIAEQRTERVLQGHEGAVRSVAFSPDSRYIATSGWDKTARVWETATGKNVGLLKEHTDITPGVAFSPDGQFIATASWDKTVRVWEAWQTPQPRVVVLLQTPSAMWCAAFSRDGRYLVTSGDDTVQVWEWRTDEGPQLRREMKLSRLKVSVYSVEFSPDGKHIAVGAGALRNVYVWEWEKDQSEEEGNQNPIVLPNCMAYDIGFSVDGKYLAAACADRSARVWDWADAEKRKTPVQISKFQSALRGVAFNKDGKRLATGGEDGVVRLWNWQEEQGREEAFELRGHKLVGDPPSRYVFSVAFNPDGQLLVTGGEDKTARVWSTEKIDTSKLTNNPQELLRIANSRKIRDFTKEEREKYLSDDE